MIDPRTMCRKHLLGEHGEIHKHRHNFVKHHSVDKRVSYPAQIIPALMEERHDELAAEMVRRGYNHKSPYQLPDLSYLPHGKRYPMFSSEANTEDLASRCPECLQLLIQGGYDGNHV